MKNIVTFYSFACFSLHLEYKFFWFITELLNLWLFPCLLPAWVIADVTVYCVLCVRVVSILPALKWAWLVRFYASYSGESIVEFFLLVKCKFFNQNILMQFTQTTHIQPRVAWEFRYRRLWPCLPQSPFAGLLRSIWLPIFIAWIGIWKIFEAFW